ncbi:efflux RND transporter permease subunit [Chloroflexi bacterium TSY]|nr:efflux RND transporter permease subunit [Chloroflexi bacterium TSY]
MLRFDQSFGTLSAFSFRSTARILCYVLSSSIAIVISTFEALTLAPLLASRFFKANTKIQEGQIDESAGREVAGRGWLDRFYGATVNWALDHRWLTLFIAAAIVATSMYGARFIQTAFIPSLDRGFFDVSMKLPPGAPLEQTEREAIQVEQIIADHPDVEAVFTTIGTSTEPEKAAFFVKVSSEAAGQEPSRRIIDDLREPLAQVPGISFALADGVGGGDTFIDGSKDIFVEVISAKKEYIEVGQEALTLIDELTANIPGLVDVTTSFNTGKPEVRIEIDRQRAADSGLTTAQVGGTIRTLINGDVASTFRGEGEEAEILVRLQESDRTQINNILDINMMSPTGQFIPLRMVAEQVEGSGPTQIQRRNRENIVTIGMNVAGRDKPEVTSDVAAFIDNYANTVYTDADDVVVKLGGDAEAQAESFTNLGMALLLAVVFIYMVLASQFGSFIQPLLIMLAMTLSIIGALVGLLITNRPMDMTAFIGFIMLMGLVTKNSILLVDFANKERAKGASADLAMRRAGPVRLRPILMTALSLILAMIPIVIGISEGSEFRQSMSIAIMGGMITSTLLTLFVVPVSYSLVIGLQDRGKEVERYRKPRRKTALDLVPQQDSNLELLPVNRNPKLALQAEKNNPAHQLETPVSDTPKQVPPTTGSPQPAGD